MDGCLVTQNTYEKKYVARLEALTKEMTFESSKETLKTLLVFPPAYAELIETGAGAIKRNRYFTWNRCTYP